MVAVNVSVNPGPPQQLSGVTKAGSLIYNRNPNSAVWVSSTQNMRPGSGMLLGPLGHVSWTNDTAIYACVDTGVISVIDLTISDDVSTVDNPIAVAAATAALLLQTGIPNVLKSDLLIALNPFLPATQFVLNFLDRYASLVVQLSGTLANVRVDYHQESELNGAFFFTREHYTNVAGDSYVSSWQVPLVGGSALIRNTGGNSAGISIYGTNRDVTGPRLLGLTNLPRRLSVTGNVVANTDSPLVINDGALTRATTFNGLCSWECTPNLAGTIRASYLDPNGTVQIRTVVDADLVAGKTTLGTFAHPMCPVYWSYRPNVTSAGVSVAFTISQS